MQISPSSTKPALQSGFLGVLTKNKTVEELRFKKYLMAYKYKNTFYQGLNNSLGAISYIVSLLFWKTLLVTQLNSVETLTTSEEGPPYSQDLNCLLTQHSVGIHPRSDTDSLVLDVTGSVPGKGARWRPASGLNSGSRVGPCAR